MAGTFIKVADLALMIYITNYVLIPELLYKKKYVWLVIAFVTTILFFSAVKMNILGRLLHNPDLYDWSHNLNSRLYDNIIPHFILVIASAAVKLMLDYGELQQRMADTAKEKAEAELNFLKSQINPHFVFNSLPKITGLDFFKTLQNAPPVIFTTAYPQYALEGFEVNALDYLVKPISFERFFKAALKAKEYYEVRDKNNTEATSAEYFFIKADNKLVKIA